MYYLVEVARRGRGRYIVLPHPPSPTEDEGILEEEFESFEEAQACAAWLSREGKGPKRGKER